MEHLHGLKHYGKLSIPSCHFSDMEFNFLLVSSFLHCLIRKRFGHARLGAFLGVTFQTWEIGKNKLKGTSSCLYKFPYHTKQNFSDRPKLRKKIGVEYSSQQ